MGVTFAAMDGLSMISALTANAVPTFGRKIARFNRMSGGYWLWQQSNGKLENAWEALVETTIKAHNKLHFIHGDMQCTMISVNDMRDPDGGEVVRALNEQDNYNEHTWGKSDPGAGRAVQQISVGQAQQGSCV